MSDDRKLQLKVQMLDEAMDALESLHGADLDRYLSEIGLDPAGLVQGYSESLNRALSNAKRARFEEARRHVRASASRTSRSRVASFDLAKKRTIMASIRALSDRTNAMTIAARNQKISSEQDLDSFLEACVSLGVIDEEGNLKG